MPTARRCRTQRSAPTSARFSRLIRASPIKAAVLPLSRGEALALYLLNEIAQDLRDDWNVDFDDSGAIGRRYRRQDEIGTPFCVTVDFRLARRQRGDCARSVTRCSRSACRAPNCTRTLLSGCADPNRLHASRYWQAQPVKMPASIRLSCQYRLSDPGRNSR